VIYYTIYIYIEREDYYVAALLHNTCLITWAEREREDYYVARPIATPSGVGHELPQQLGLFIAGLNDRCDRLSQARRWEWVSVLLGALGPISSVAGVHHLLSNMLPLA
jgi:hypothetical protein